MSINAMDDVADLVLTPFRDIVDKAKTAVVNAQDAQPMLKASQALVKEGERALRKIEPLCKKNLDEYGLSFLAALKENDEIAAYRTELADLLWDFDDFTEADDFDQDKFTEIQSLSRKAAPRISDILIRMKLEVQPAAKENARNFMSQLSPPSSPPLPLQSPTLPLQAPSSRSSHSSFVSPLQPSPLALPVQPPPLSVAMQSPPLSMPMQPPPNAPLPPLPPFQQPRIRNSVASSVEARSPSGANVEDAANHLTRVSMRPTSQSATVEYLSSDAGQDEPQEQPPRPPSTNPWDLRPHSTSIDAPESPIERRAPVNPESPVLPSPISPDNERRFSRALPRAHSRNSGQSDGMSQDGDDRRRASNGSGPVYNIFPTQRPRAPTLPSNISQPIPEENTLPDTSEAVESPVGSFPTSLYSQHSRQPSQPGSFTSDLRSNTMFNERPSIFGVDRRISFASSDHRPSVAQSDHRPSVASTDPRSNFASADHRPSYSTINSTASSQLTTITHDLSQSQPGLEVVPDSFGTRDFDHGLILAGGENNNSAPAVQMPRRDCSIRGGSSFYIHKGFCEGSKEVLRGGIGVRKTKKPGFATAYTVARCTSCLYELDFKDIENDVNRLDKGSYTKSGIEFRLRFLQKSHLPIKRMDDIMYGCIFCIQAGHTLDESDATVFFSTKALFAHIARHPRPLPEIAGMTIIHAEEVPSELVNDFDLHFTGPPLVNPASENATFIQQQPAGTAREQARRLYGQRLLHDRSAALELAQGARVTGIEWPEQYHGDWCHGWHDGVHATVPTDIMRIDPPPNDQIKLSVPSMIRAKSRWRFSPKDKDKGDWLKFDKDEVITNINWPYPEHWCWSGTNSKGKWGIFPQVFIEPNTVQELTSSASDRASTLDVEKNKSSGFLSRFSSRKGSGRPPSVAGSTSSHETSGSTPYLYGTK